MFVTTSSPLRPGLPFAFLTTDFNYVPAVIIQQKGYPQHVKLDKYYFRPQLEELESRSFNVETLGIATKNEWYKGLEATGQEKNADAARFDKWELQGALSRFHDLSGLNATNAHFTPGTDVIPGRRVPGFDHLLRPCSRSAVATPSSGYVAFESSTRDTVSDGKHHLVRSSSSLSV